MSDKPSDRDGREAAGIFKAAFMGSRHKFCPCGCGSYWHVADCPDGLITPEVARAIYRIVAALNEVYLPEGVLIWLKHPNRNLGMQTPADLIAGGRLSEVSAVLAEAERLSVGAW